MKKANCSLKNCGWEYLRLQEYQRGVGHSMVIPLDPGECLHQPNGLLLLDGVLSDQVSQSWVCAGGLEIRERVPVELSPRKGSTGTRIFYQVLAPRFFFLRKTAEDQEIPQSHTMQRISLKRFIGGVSPE